MWIDIKFVVFIANGYLSMDLIMYFRQMQYNKSLGKTPKDRTKRYMNFLEGYTSDTANDINH